jgi:hypothetical protein
LTNLLSHDSNTFARNQALSPEPSGAPRYGGAVAVEGNAQATFCG